MHVHLLHLQSATQTQTLAIHALSLVMILSVSDSSQSKGGQIALISLNLYKQSIPLKDEGCCSFPLPARS